MAFPTVRSVGGAGNGTTGAVSVSSPVAIQVGDLDILISTTIAGGTVSITTVAGGAWTAFPNTPIDVTAGEKLYAWWRVGLAGDGDPSVTPGSDHSISARFAVTTGTFDATTPIESSVTSTEVTSDTTFSFAPGNSTLGTDRLCVVVCSNGTDTNTAQGGTDTANASLTNVTATPIINANTLSGGGGGFFVATGTLAAAGSIGTWTQTMVGATPKAYLSFAVLPSLIVAHPNVVRRVGSGA